MMEIFPVNVNRPRISKNSPRADQIDTEDSYLISVRISLAIIIDTNLSFSPLNSGYFSVIWKIRALISAMAPRLLVN